MRQSEIVREKNYPGTIHFVKPDFSGDPKCVGFFLVVPFYLLASQAHYQ